MVRLNGTRGKHRKTKMHKNKSRKNKSKKGGTPISSRCAICGEENEGLTGYGSINGSTIVCSNNHAFHFRCICNRKNCPIPTCKQRIEPRVFERIQEWCCPHTKQEQLNALGKMSLKELYHRNNNGKRCKI